MASQQVPNDSRASALVARLGSAREELLHEFHQVVVGQDDVLEHLLIALFAGGHCLLEGVPGLAKTVMVQTLGQVCDLRSSRIQFTPDLMPADITGTDIIQEDPDSGRRQYEFLAGPLFANLVLADEINRTPPKTQAALLQAMQERATTVRGRTWELPDPFFVLATQNPIEQEGTYVLPEAQLDRFLMQIVVNYPSAKEELEILRRTGNPAPTLRRVLSVSELRRTQDLAREVPVAEPIYDLIVRSVRATRPAESPLPEMQRFLQWGAGPRAGQMLLRAARARALLHGRFHVAGDDVLALIEPVLRHRLVLSFAGQAEGISVVHLLKQLRRHLGAEA